MSSSAAADAALSSPLALRLLFNAYADVAGAGDDPSKFAERAVPVIEAVQGVLNHLTAVKARMEDPIKPRIFLDSTIATVLKAIAKKFPDAEPGNQVLRARPRSA